MACFVENGRYSVSLLISYGEFFAQGDQEKALGLNYSSELVDRSKMPEIPRMQVGFYKFVVSPAFELLHSVFGQKVLDMCQSVRYNEQQWVKLNESKLQFKFGLEFD
jgi:hypothetical protein